MGRLSEEELNICEDERLQGPDNPLGHVLKRAAAEIRELRAGLDSCENENNSLRMLNDAHCKARDRLEAENAKMREGLMTSAGERKILREENARMRDYVRHGRLSDRIMCERDKGEGYPCTCGLDELLKEAGDERLS